MVSQTAFQLTLDFLTSKPIVVEPSAEQVSSDAGLLPFRQFDERLGLTRQFAEALSDHRYFANLFRLYLHSAAYNLLVRMRRAVTDPPHESNGKAIPVEALAGRQRRQWHNRRRGHDPLGEGQPCTWRTRLIKVAARVRESTRRVVVELSASWPYLNYFQEVLQRLLVSSSAAPNSS